MNTERYNNPKNNSELSVKQKAMLGLGAAALAAAVMFGGGVVEHAPQQSSVEGQPSTEQIEQGNHVDFSSITHPYRVGPGEGVSAAAATIEGVNDPQDIDIAVEYIEAMPENAKVLASGYPQNGAILHVPNSVEIG